MTIKFLELELAVVAPHTVVRTSVDEQDVVLIDRTMNHVGVWLTGQQMLVEPLAAIFEGLRGKYNFKQHHAALP